MALNTCVDKGKDLKFELSHSKYLYSHVHIASKNPFGLWGPYGASEVKSRLRFEISDTNYLHVHIAYIAWALLAASKATSAPRSNPTSDLK